MPSPITIHGSDSGDAESESSGSESDSDLDDNVAELTRPKCNIINKIPKDPKGRGQKLKCKEKQHI